MGWRRHLGEGTHGKSLGEFRSAPGCMSSSMSNVAESAASFPLARQTVARLRSMRDKLIRPTASEDARIARGIAADPDAAPDLSKAIAGVVRRVGRPPKADRKVSVTLRLDREVVERFKAAGAGWQTRINAALKKSLAR